MNQKPTVNQIASLQKLFILDREGAYAAEYPVDDMCKVEFNDFVASLRGAALTDSRTLQLGGYCATLLEGGEISLVAISRGPLRSVELAWAKAVLAATEGYLNQETPEGGESPKTDERESEARLRKLEEREKAIEQREKAVSEAEERAWTLIEQENDNAGEGESLRRQLAEMETKMKEERERYEGEVEKLKAQVGDSWVASTFGVQETPSQQEIDRLNAERDLLRQKAEQLEAREKALQERAAGLAVQVQPESEDKTEAAAGGEDVEAARRSIPSFDVEEALSELERKAAIVEEKALEILDRESKINKKEDQLHRLMELEVK